ncbi:hypothetical protein Y1Q_0002928 [Alligator mississippiensis]|uniref:Uncharacterized protein n=1 Tax=Alligator mississippiensis TaxID=8496 RepID=A0A151MCW2_ALLMI|nr:hypothetical protein Y1Q_0002928 [Alligator mississippiensis]
MGIITTNYKWNLKIDTKHTSQEVTRYQWKADYFLCQSLFYLHISQDTLQQAAIKLIGLSLKTQFPGQMPCSEIFRGGSCHVQRLAEQQSKMSRSYREAARWEYGLGVKCNLTIIL